MRVSPPGQAALGRPRHAQRCGQGRGRVGLALSSGQRKTLASPQRPRPGQAGARGHAGRAPGSTGGLEPWAGADERHPSTFTSTPGWSPARTPQRTGRRSSCSAAARRTRRTRRAGRGSPAGAPGRRPGRGCRPPPRCRRWGASRPGPGGPTPAAAAPRPRPGPGSRAAGAGASRGSAARRDRVRVRVGLGSIHRCERRRKLQRARMGCASALQRSASAARRGDADGRCEPHSRG